MAKSIRRLTWVLTLFFAVNGRASALVGSCVDVDKQGACAKPGEYLRDFLEVVNRHRHLPVSKVIEALRFPKGTVVGAEFSHSLQSSDTTDNPRVHIGTPCGSLTLNLFGNSIEMAISEQTADFGLQLPVAPYVPGNFSIGAGVGRFSASKGELLLDIHPFPKVSGPFTAEAITNSLNPDFPRNAVGRSATVNGNQIWHDTKQCSQCHVDSRAGGTKSSLGVRPLTVGAERVLAIVSPYERIPSRLAHHRVYCVPRDLRLLHQCKCERGIAPKACVHFDPKRWSGPSGDEACARLKVLLTIAPSQHCAFDPTERAANPQDPQANQCLSDK